MLLNYEALEAVLLEDALDFRPTVTNRLDAVTLIGIQVCAVFIDYGIQKDKVLQRYAEFDG